jgi:hypothetical protein
MIDPAGSADHYHERRRVSASIVTTLIGEINCGETFPG